MFSFEFLFLRIFTSIRLGLFCTGRTHQSPGEIPCLKRPKICNPLSHPNKRDRYRKLLRQRNHHSAPGCAIKLCDADAGQADFLLKGGRLGKRVLTRSSVHHEQSFMGCRRIGLGQPSPNLGKLCHQIGIHMLSSGGINDQYLCAPAFSSAQSIMRHCRGIRTV